MGVTLAEMRSRIVRNLGGSSTTEYDLSLPASDLTSIVNECLAAVDIEQDWVWNEVAETISTVAGTYLYTPAGTGWYRTKSLVHPDNGPLDYVSLNRIEQEWPVVTDRACPYWFAERAGQLDIRPTPDTVIALRHVYFRAEPELIDDADEPLLPDRYRGRVIDAATAEAASRVRLWAIQQRYQVKDPTWQRRMADDNRRTSARTGVRARPGRWGG